MPTVTGTIVTPDGTAVAGATVSFALDTGRAWRNSDDDLIVSPITEVTDENGEYSLTLPGNADLDPANSRYVRTVTFGGGARRGMAALVDELIVPSAGGPYNEHDLLAESLDPLPTPTATNDLDRADITANTSATATNVLTLIAVPGLVVDVPDLDTGCYVKATLNIQNSAANPAIVASVAPVGATVSTTPQQQAAETGGAAASQKTVTAELYLPPHSAGQYQAFHCGSTGNQQVNGSQTSRSSIVVRSA